MSYSAPQSPRKACIALSHLLKRTGGSGSDRRLLPPHLYQHYLDGGIDLQQPGAKNHVKSDRHLHDMVPQTMSQTKAERDR